jgi:glycosyltransferase involved in cell wall biosynthesis
MTSIPAAVSLAVHRKRGTYEQEVDLFAALTDFTRTLMIESGIPEDRIVVKPNFVEDPGAPSVRSDTSETLLYVGRLESSKGVGQLARIWRDRKAPFPLTVVGDGPLRPELDRLPGVTTTGWLPRDRVGDLIAQARAVLVPSLWYEGQPLVVLESFARGTPVVASAHGGLGETVRPANPELLVEPGDVDSLLDAFEKLKDSAFVGEAGRRSRQVYESKHTPEVAVRKLESIYQAAIAVRRRR